MKPGTDLRFPFIFAAALIVFCCSAGRARAELTDSIYPEAAAAGVTATPGNIPEELPGDTAQEEDAEERDTEEIKEQSGEDRSAEDAAYLPATPGSYSEGPEAQRAAALLKGYAVYSTQAAPQAAESAAASDRNNLECIELSAEASLTGPDSVEIHLLVKAEPMRFYGFELGRSEEMDELSLHLEDPDVCITIPDYATESAVPVPGDIDIGTVSIDSFTMKRNRYGEYRALEITWRLEGTDVLQDFAAGLAGDTLFLSLGGEYELPAGSGEDVVSHQGPVEVTGLSEAVRIGSCPHTGIEYTSLDEEVHSLVCGSCGYAFPEEEHHITAGRCGECGFLVIVRGEVEHILNGRTVTGSYEGVEENPYTPERFPGYFPPEDVILPRGGGRITVYHEPVQYRIRTEDEEYLLRYDESLFLPGGKRKGYTCESYVAADVIRVSP